MICHVFSLIYVIFGALRLQLKQLCRVFLPQKCTSRWEAEFGCVWSSRWHAPHSCRPSHPRRACRVQCGPKDRGGPMVSRSKSPVIQPQFQNRWIFRSLYAFFIGEVSWVNQVNLAATLKLAEKGKFHGNVAAKVTWYLFIVWKVIFSVIRSCTIVCIFFLGKIAFRAKSWISSTKKGATMDSSKRTVFGKPSFFGKKVVPMQTWLSITLHTRAFWALWGSNIFYINRS